MVTKDEDTDKVVKEHEELTSKNTVEIKNGEIVRNIKKDTRKKKIDIVMAIRQRFKLPPPQKPN